MTFFCDFIYSFVLITLCNLVG